MNAKKLVSIALTIVPVLVICVLVSGCGEKATEPELNPMGVFSEVGDSISGDNSTMRSPLAASAATWPRRLADFKFPYRYGEAWKITCGYGCYKHKYTNYPRAGVYSVDLVRVYRQTAGSCVLAPARGIVEFAGWMSGYGWCVVMDHDAGNTGLKYKSIEAHLASDPNQFVHKGDDLLAGTILGYCGSSGTSSPHIHFGVWKNNVSVPINDISGHRNLYVDRKYYSYNWAVQPPRSRCACYRND
ncbi:M23 family metallopeptidase [Patescibacteria group bacterium]